jgi:hypothetical protein
MDITLFYQPSRVNAVAEKFHGLFHTARAVSRNRDASYGRRHKQVSSMQFPVAFDCALNLASIPNWCFRVPAHRYRLGSGNLVRIGLGPYRCTPQDRDGRLARCAEHPQTRRHDGIPRRQSDNVQRPRQSRRPGRLEQDRTGVMAVEIAMD